MGDVVILSTVTSLDLPPDRVLEQALGQLKTVVIMGYTEDGDRYFASSVADGGDVLWLLEQCKLDLLNVEV